MPIGTSHVRSTPCRVFPSPPYVDFYVENGGPGIETRGPLTLTLSLTLPLTLTLTSTQEDGAGWAAQRTGRRLVVGGLEALGATGRPGASTPVATRPPGIAGSLSLTL